MTEFKDMLKFLRIQRGLSQRELAEKIHVSGSTIGMYESGKRRPRPDDEEAIADFFNVSLNTLRGKDTDQALDQAKIEFLEQFDQLNERDQKAVMNLIASLLSKF